MNFKQSLIVSIYLISATELVKSEKVFIAEIFDPTLDARIILRDNGSCEFENYHDPKTKLWIQKGTYSISQDTISLTILPYKIYRNPEEDIFWCLHSNQQTNHLVDTVIIEIIKNEIY